MITLAVFFISLFMGLPILITLLVGTLVFLQQSDLSMLMGSLPLQLYGSLEKSGLLAIPLFMMVGELMNRGGLTDRLIALASMLVGRLHGGLAYVNLLTNAITSSILGSALAQIAVMSRVMIPAMEKKGFKRDFASAVTVSGGLLGPIIPPSMVMIIYGVIAFQPVGALFMAGVVPGILITIGFAIIIFLIGLFCGFPREGQADAPKVTPAEFLKDIVPLSIPLIIITGIAAGVMTPTEAGAIGSLLALLIGTLVYRSLRWSELPDVLFRVALNAAMITGLIASATMFGWALSFEEVPDRVVALINGVTDSPIVFLLLINLLIIVLGMFLESMSILIVMVPIVLPAALAMGIDPIHFGVVISLATLVGLVTPPLGPGLFVVMATTPISMSALFKSMMPFLLMMFLCMALINVVPALSLWLPAMFGLM
ncbi:C4-dicarboxylate ABC transporter permease [Marinobacterium zhoushanense]|uniref:TRAP transporter large permease protein n=1 Tax=Marinobacterium zhoushanense TaxID=1679163 RepID=A0ABQ1K0R0_9GAMM|nr:TRAP transporter large permease [Marinobacterium zhoushanense]GGB84504.1 C4-dicarboxylate ABC transporter permease [Marinobacterium zhoushanense]